MCGALAIAPVAALASSLFSSGKSKGVQSYSPSEMEMNVTNPQPELEEPQLGVDNNDNQAAAKKGKSALVIQRNPAIGVPGSTTGTGVSIPRG